MLLTLRAVLHRACRVAGGAEFVHHSGDVFHLPVDHSLDIVHVEQVQALQTTLQNRDLAPGVTQADGHPVHLHLRERGGEGSYLFWLNVTGLFYHTIMALEHNRMAVFQTDHQSQ